MMKLPPLHIRQRAQASLVGLLKDHPRATLIGGLGLIGVFTGVLKPPPPAPPAPPPPPPPDETIPSRVQSSLVEPVVGPLLKDPTSARYENVTLRKRAKQWVFCGDVASKNSFGAYNGFQSFVTIGPIVQLQEGMSSRRFTDLWNTFCVKTDHDDAAHKAARAKVTAGARHGGS